jgi:hypothetical protein
MLITCAKTWIFLPAVLAAGIFLSLFLYHSHIFHYFLLKKDINLLILHQNRKMWISKLKYSLSERNNPQS